MSAGTTLGFAAGGLNIANDLVISGDPIVDVGLLETLSGEISDPNGGAPAGVLKKADSGTLLLTRANTYSGGTNIEGGMLELGDANAAGTGALTMSAGTTLGFAGSGLNIANDLVISGDPIVDVGLFETLSGEISDPNGGAPAGVLKKADSGTLLLTRANTYSGGTNIEGGTLELGDANAAGTGSIKMSAGTTLGFAASGLNIANNLVISGDPIVDVGLFETLSGEISDPNRGGPAGVLERPTVERSC